MLDLVLSKLGDGHFLALMLASLGCVVTALTVIAPMLQGDNLSRRMKAVGSERERIRQRERERERLAASPNKTQLRARPSTVLKSVVDALNLTSWLSTETAKQTLAKAGFRGVGAEYAFVAFRLVAPIGFAVVAIVYIFFIAKWTQPLPMRIGFVMMAMYMGVKAPEVYLRNATSKRQMALERAYPNALDLMLICAESGMSVEHTVRKVSAEIGVESVEMAEELTLLAAEMSYLQDRRAPYENLNTRTGLESVRSLTTVLIQSERYGTPLGAALRVLSQESRDQRMNKAEKKAASLPPTLTVPMILFFLPGLFAAILTPAAIQINHWS
jgi:tight adherence protein C